MYKRQRLHCLRAIDHVACGAHGLPLMGGGDWNDGMNRVGGENGESVWLGMFLCEVLRLFAHLCDPSDTQMCIRDSAAGVPVCPRVDGPQRCRF